MSAGAVERTGSNPREIDHGRCGMFQRLWYVGHVLASAVVKASAAVPDAWRTTMANQAGRYRPEAHYMRGPGPKWRARRPAVERTWQRQRRTRARRSHGGHRAQAQACRQQLAPLSWWTRLARNWLG